MSLDTWKAEFYPEDAYRAAESSEIAAIEHSLRKWTGLRRDALDRHRCNEKPGSDVTDSKYNSLYIDSGTCALCVAFLREGAEADRSEGCNLCPLRNALGHRCDGDSTEEYAASPFGLWRETFDPEPMIAGLEKALAIARAQADRGAK